MPFHGTPAPQSHRQRVQLVGHRLQELRAARGTQPTVRRVSGRSSLGGGVDFLRCGLVEILRQGFAGGCIQALQRDAAEGAALAADVVVAEEQGHETLLKG